MAKDRLKRSIAEALTGPSVRDDLVRILAGHEAPLQREPHAAPAPDPRQRQRPDPDGRPRRHRSGGQRRRGAVARCAGRGHRRLRRRAVHPAAGAGAAHARRARRSRRRHVRRRVARAHRGATQRRPAADGRGHGQPRQSRPEHVLRALHARRHGAPAGRAGAARERSALSRARRERARGHRRARRRPQRLRRCQRQCRQAVQAAARGAARAKGPKRCAPSFKATGFRPPVCIAATSTARCAARGPSSSGCIATVRARTCRARCGSFACRPRSNG